MRNSTVGGVALLALVFSLGLAAPAQARLGPSAPTYAASASPRRAPTRDAITRRLSTRSGRLLRASSLCLMVALAGPAAADEDVMTYRPCSPAQFRDAVAVLAKEAPEAGVAVGAATVVKGSDGRPVLTVPLTKQGFFSPYTFRVAVPTRQPPDEGALAQLTRALRGKQDPATVRALEALSQLVVTTPAHGSPWDVPNNLQSAAQRLNLPSHCPLVAAAPSSSSRLAQQGAGSAALARLD
ncbi:MAG: hypothetical protein IPL40_02735 [Proteobacteria bacterium]|nr:hypothetical protein [Pseudomonadota bacterium]